MNNKDRFLTWAPLFVLAIAVAIIGFFVIHMVPLLQSQGASPVLGSNSGTGFQPTFGSSSTANATATVGALVSQVVPAGWNNYVRISNLDSRPVSCSADGLTAASSSAGVGRGVTIYPSSSANNVVCFGPAVGCVPYSGALNCIAAASTSIGILKN